MDFVEKSESKKITALYVWCLELDENYI